MDGAAELGSGAGHWPLIQLGTAFVPYAAIRKAELVADCSLWCGAEIRADGDGLLKWNSVADIISISESSLSEDF